jgi:hypothetical protein
MCPHTSICVSSYLYICVLIPLYMCSHTTIYLSSYYYTSHRLSQAFRYICPHTSIYLPSYLYMCVLIPLYMSPHTSLYMSAYFYICVLTPLYISLYIRPHILHMSSYTPLSRCPRSTHVLIYTSLHMSSHICPHTTTCVLILLYSSMRTHI